MLRAHVSGDLIGTSQWTITPNGAGSVAVFAALGLGLQDDRRRRQQGDDFVEAEQVAQVVHGGQVGRVADDDGQHFVLQERFS